MSYPLWHSFIFITVTLSWLLSPTLPFCHPGYSYEESTYYNNTDWMAAIRDDTPLNNMSIPGTHDSLKKNYFLWSKTQTMDLHTQLNSGIRFLDITVAYDDKRNDFFVEGGSTLVKLVRTLNDFLVKHPTETILLLINRGEGFDSSQFTIEMLRIHVILYYYVLWPSSDTNSIPSLGHVRNYVVLLHDLEDFVYGLYYPTHFVVQDKTYMATNWDLHEKWLEVKHFLYEAGSHTQSLQDKILLNWLSGWGGSFPYFVVSGHVSQGTCAGQLITGASLPWFPNTFVDFHRYCSEGRRYCDILFIGTNMLAQEEIVKNPDWKRVGIVATDFPGPGLIDSIIAVNRYNSITGFYPGKYFRVHPGTLLTASLDLNVQKMVPIIWNNHDGANQVWIFDYVVSKKYYIIRSYYNYDLALTWDGTLPNGGVTCSKYNDGDGQHWLLPVFSFEFLHYIVPYNDTSLALTFTTSTNGSQITVSPKNVIDSVNVNQRFLFEKTTIYKFD